MKETIKQGDTRLHQFVVKDDHFPNFGDKVVHPVCSTYVLAREIEWSTRLFMLDVIEEDEEGIGTMLEISHLNPAFEGETVQIMAVLNSFDRNSMICEFRALVGDRLIAVGKTGQKLLKNKQLQSLYQRPNN